LSADVNFESFSKVLKNQIRSKIVLSLSSSKSLTYMDLINAVEVSNTGKFNYHLKLLGDLIKKDSTDRYVLTEKGQLAAQFLQKFPEMKTQPTTLHMADAVLIGLAGLALLAANPILWLGLWLDANKATVPIITIPLFIPASFLYTLLIPSTVMWLFSVRRTNSHGMYNLLKGPLVTFIFLLLFLMTMLILKFDIVAHIKAPLIVYNQSHTTQIITGLSFGIVFFQGLITSFLGVPVIESILRIKKRINLNR
jgi:hypothetical protein